MTRVAERTEQAILPATERRIHPAQVLAIVGAVFLFFEIWTLSSWASHGITQVTQYRDRNTTDWWAAIVYESLAVLAAVVIITYVVRGCIRERKFTFDATFCVATLLLYWVDPFANWLQPIFFYSSNWVNVKNWCGNAPFVVNPTCGQLPEPVLFLLPLYGFGFLGFVIGMNALMKAVRKRRPGISNLRLIGIALLVGCVIDLLLEGPIVLYRLWIYPGWPLSLTGGGLQKYPLFEPIIASILWTTLGSIRFFVNDRGERVVQRGLTHHRPMVRTGLVVLALIGASQSAAFVSNSILIVNGLYIHDMPAMPAYDDNGMCNDGTITGTRYGPCPGTPGFRMPIRTIQP